MQQSKLTLIVSGLAVSLFGVSAAFAQSAAVSIGSPGYVNAEPVNADQINPNLTVPGFTLSMPPSGNSNDIFLTPTYGRTTPGVPSFFHFDNEGNTIPGLSTISTFGGAFAAEAGPSQGQVYKYTMVGNNPPTAARPTFPRESTRCPGPC